ncbi:MAG: flippase [Candidatus Promineofilum sp.]|nr:flippase [Promineifilum sp.]
MEKQDRQHANSQPRPIRHNALVKLTSELIGRLALFALVLFAARRLGEAGFGLYNYALALGFILAQLTDLGMQLVLTREIATGARGGALVSAALRLKVVLSLVVAAMLWLVVADRPVERSAIFLLSLLPLLQSFPEFVGYVFRGRQNLTVEARLLAGARLALAGAGVVALWLWPTLLALAISQAAVGLLFALIGLVWLRRGGWLARLGEALAVHRLPQQRAELGYLLRQSLPLGVAIFLSIAYVRLAVLLLQYRLGETAVAHFSAAARLTEPAQLIPASIMAAVFPAFALALRHDAAGARRLGARATLLLLAVGAGVALGGWLLGPWLVPWLYGPAYGASSRVFQVLALSLVPAFVNYTLTHYLIARGQQALMGAFTGAMLVLHAALSWVLIPRLGPVGPALSIVLAELLLTILCAAALSATAAPPPRPAEDVADTLPA